ncbi:hypothetical protein CEXT_257531 [Caerostris extrusa]|uniref:Uncharacterized protein n=1 Tax=Caerostris extrusa TaxID=172846 RepID=A0AAV4S884_CAEEX|nr:hypothetical protein CEXT_257531 [Caerostris extrusa]
MHLQRLDQTLKWRHLIKFFAIHCVRKPPQPNRSGREPFPLPYLPHPHCKILPSEPKDSILCGHPTAKEEAPE